MSGMTGSDTNSPPGQQYGGRKNKLGYTRISVACMHCRRRKIRCVTPDNGTENRCANCIKLKKDCIFTGIEHGDDAEPSSSKSMPRSQTPSNVSRSPIEAEPDRYPTANPQLSNVPSPLGATTTAFSGNVAIAASQGITLSSDAPVDQSFRIDPGHLAEWQPYNEDMSFQAYHEHQQQPHPQHSTMQWPDNSDDQLQAYHQQHALMQASHHPLHHQFVDAHAHAHAHSQMHPHPQWVPQHHSSIGVPMAGTLPYGTAQPQIFYPSQYPRSPQNVAQAPILRSQAYPPNSNPSAVAESQVGAWGPHQHASTGEEAPRHDSMATTWARTHPGRGRVGAE